MFKKKKLYLIKYSMLLTYSTIIAAKDEIQAVRKFNRKHSSTLHKIISIEEYKVGEQQ